MSFVSVQLSVESKPLFAGCVGAELLLGQPLFPGDSGVDQLVEIIKVSCFISNPQIFFLQPFLQNQGTYKDI